MAAWRLGAGRSRKEDPVQAGAGVRWHARPGDQVTEGEPLMTLLTDEPDRFERALESLDGGYDIEDGGVVHAGAARDRPGELTVDLAAGQELVVSRPRIRMGVGWDKDRTAGAIGTGAPDIDLDATARAVRGRSAVRPGVLQQPRDPGRLGRPPRRQPDRCRRGRRRGRSPSTSTRSTDRSTRSCSWSAATRATRWSGSTGYCRVTTSRAPSWPRFTISGGPDRPAWCWPRSSGAGRRLDPARRR